MAIKGKRNIGGRANTNSSKDNVKTKRGYR